MQKRIAGPAKILKEKDANRKILAGRSFAVIGFGPMGKAMALNLRDCGYGVRIGLRNRSASAEEAKKMGFKVLPVADALKSSEICVLAVPETALPDVIGCADAGSLKGKTLVFLSGAGLQLGYVSPVDGANIVLVSPKGPAIAVRFEFEKGMGVPAFIAVHQGGKIAREIALAIADAIGSTRAGVIETTFEEDAQTSLFSEQAVVCGGLRALVSAGFETLVEAGYKPEMAYFECCNQLKYMADLLCQRGISGMRMAVSQMHRYGDVTRGDRVVSDKSKREMKKILSEIRSGKFAKEWQKECMQGKKRYAKALSAGQQHPIEKAGQRLRSLMPLLAKQNVKGAGGAFVQLTRKKD